MPDLTQLGNVLTTDVLIIGSGLSGTVAALKLKQLDPKVDIICLERNYYGYNGQTTKAGHGAGYMSPEDDVDKFCKEQVEENNYGLYLNDQDVLYGHAEGLKTYVKELEELGAVFAHEEDGSLHYHREYPTKPTSSVNVDLDLIVPLTKRALGQGVRVLERFYFTDLLTADGKCIGGVGFNKDTLEFYIIRAKAVIMASCEFNPVVRQMFYSGGNGLWAAYEAGAALRNVEQSTNFDLCHRNTANFMYGMHWVIHNSKGENVFQKYQSGNFEEIDMKLVQGMLNEVKLGNYPFYVDFSKLPQTSETEGEGFNQGMLMPTRLALDEFIFSHQKVDNRLTMPEISLVTYVFSRSLKIDFESRTTLPNLWATGGMTLAGSAFGGWLHGDGIGYCSRTGMYAAKSIAKKLPEIELGEVNVEQVEFFKNRLYEPLSWKGKELPYQTIHFLDRVIQMPENSMDRTEESIRAMLDLLKEEKENLPNNMYVPSGSGHHLYKSVEARCMLNMLEVMYTAFGARKESRGFQLRADYPERDDENWLKWIDITMGADKKPHIEYVPVPIERYKWKPAGWKPAAAL